VHHPAPRPTAPAACNRGARRAELLARVRGRTPRLHARLWVSRRRRRVGPALPSSSVQACPSSIFLDQNRRGVGESQSKWTAAKMGTPDSRSVEMLPIDRG
jgi:hypothetical protein